ncbi:MULTISPECIES: glycoside hydrolase family 20 protein [unclassified Spirosoma]|uniref:glycoside hydrolase family 20 protein n=1 Tax=unclassified Spirosoma TaxID=2621999 RepID=UPI0009598808|nr:MULTISPECIES: glycoside hydrolase family 20 protein [unclassified Spirosoma]MBN8823245.1 family 20 glycosylhydrolase [Spirosoma sp.]OJW72606.1 MAG: beta-N-acetylhexosaminidase [Spirosoma sp. 48-14]
MITRFLVFVALYFLWSPTFCQTTDRYTIIPQPAQLEPQAGEFIIDHTTTILVPATDTELKSIADQFALQVSRSTGISLGVRPTTQVALPGQTSGTNLIQFLPLRDSTMGLEGYHLDITPRQITVQATTPKGFFYAIQTLYQLLPPIVVRTGAGAKGIGSLLEGNSPAQSPMLLTLPVPACHIQDKPRYSYRGMHLDVGRHFFSVDFLKKYLDLMALHKFNAFHWHLTDDQGWRIEIKKYPKLTQIGSHRSETILGHYDEYDPQVFDGKPYGGYYTQDDIREVVRYAASRYITIVPEIELPGHATAALASYPELGCSPQKGYQVATKWGVFGDVFCPTEKTFAFLEDVLTEVMALFPGQYIHIGGDECPKSTWRQSAFCQQLIKREKLKNANELQRYFIKRIDQFVSSKGRRIIGWDEILEGASPKLRLSAQATVMCWRGIRGGIQAARQHHDVIMTPGQFCYFDHLQGDPQQEPTGFGGSLPLASVYSYDPTPAGLTSEEASHILGAQGNLWTEYIPTPQQAEYMLWPRAAALAEVVWTPLAQKNYPDFLRRLMAHFTRLDYLNVSYSRTIFDALPIAKPTAERQLEVSLIPTDPAMGNLIQNIRYTTNGTIPSSESPQYDKPILLTQSTTIRTATFSMGKPVSQSAKVEKDFIVSKATGKPYTLLNAPTSGRPDRGYSLTDGNTGSVGGYEVAGVVAFRNDFNVIVDLGKSETVERVRVGFLKYTARNLCLPKQVDLSVSEDGKTFTPVLTAKTNAAEGGKRGFVRLPFDFAPTQARYIRIIAHNVNLVPAGLRNPGKPAQLAVDELEVN